MLGSDTSDGTSDIQVKCEGSGDKNRDNEAGNDEDKTAIDDGKAKYFKTRDSFNKVIVLRKFSRENKWDFVEKLNVNKFFSNKTPRYS